MKQIGIQLPKESHEAVMNGASKFIVVIDIDIRDIVYKCIKQVLLNNMPIDMVENIEINNKDTLLASFDFDSLDCVEMATDLEHRLGIIISDEDLSKLDTVDEIIKHCQENIYKSDLAPLQIGDEFYLQEEFEEIISQPEVGGVCIQRNASQMTPKQSRYKGKILNIEIERIQDLVAIDGELVDYVNSLSDEIYDQNPYVFIYTIEETR